MSHADSRHRALLEALEGKTNVSQRTLAERLGMAASQVNRLIGELLELGYLEIVDEQVRPFAYRLTEAGRRYRRRLSHAHVRSVMGSYRRMQARIRARLRAIRHMDVRRVVLYGAGEVMEVTLPLAEEVGLDVVAVVDDDPHKQGNLRAGNGVDPPDRISALHPDGVIITTFRRSKEIRERISSQVPDGVQVVEL